MLLIPKISVGQQISECSGSKARYAATPDPNTIGAGFISHYEWILDNGVSSKTIYGNGDSIDIQWVKTPGVYKLGVIQSTDFNITGITSLCTSGDTSWTDITLTGYWAQIIGKTEYNEGDSFKFTVAMANTYDSVIWNKTLNNTVYSGVAKTTDTINVDVYTSGCHSAAQVIMIVHPLPRFNITNNGKVFKDTMLCGAESIKLDAGNLTGVSYKWANNDTTQSIIFDALQPSSDSAFYHLWATLTNQYGGKWSDTVVIQRCNNYTVTVDSFRSTYPRTKRSAGNDPSFVAHLERATLDATDTLTIWYYVAEDDTTSVSKSFAPGHPSGFVDITGKNYSTYFNGTEDVLRTVVVSAVKISSREIVRYAKGKEPRGKYFIIHKPRIKDFKYIP